MAHTEWWLLNYGKGWCMPPGTTWGSATLRAYAAAQGVPGSGLSAEMCEAYLRSIGAIPVAEICARVEAAEAEWHKWREDAERLAACLHKPCEGCGYGGYPQCRHPSGVFCEYRNHLRGFRDALAAHEALVREASDEH